jgi:hypothetical protein
MKVNITKQDITSLQKTGCLKWDNPDIELCLVKEIADEKKLDEGKKVIEY